MEGLKCDIKYLLKSTKFYEITIDIVELNLKLTLERFYMEPWVSIQALLCS